MGIERRLAGFGLAAITAFVVDLGVLLVAVSLGLDPYSGRIVSFLTAATVAWLIIRNFAIPELSAPRGLLGEWGEYMGLMLVGGGLNYLCYAVMVTLLGSNAAVLAWGVGVGFVVALGFNLLVMRYWIVLRQGRKAESADGS